MTDPLNRVKIEADGTSTDWEAAMRELTRTEVPKLAPAPAPEGLGEAKTEIAPVTQVYEPGKEPHPMVIPTRLAGRDDPEATVPLAPQPHPMNAPTRAMSRYEQLCKTPTLQIGKADVSCMADFSEIIAKVSAANRAVEALFKAHPELVPERHQKSCLGNLKDTQMVMLKEFHAMRNGRVQKKYDKRNICPRCDNVFLEPLPPGEVCDACKGETTKGSAPY